MASAIPRRGVASQAPPALTMGPQQISFQNTGERVRLGNSVATRMPRRSSGCMAGDSSGKRCSLACPTGESGSRPRQHPARRPCHGRLYRDRLPRKRHSQGYQQGAQRGPRCRSRAQRPTVVPPGLLRAAHSSRATLLPGLQCGPCSALRGGLYQGHVPWFPGARSECLDLTTDHLLRDTGDPGESLVDDGFHVPDKRSDLSTLFWEDLDTCNKRVINRRPYLREKTDVDLLYPFNFCNALLCENGLRGGCRSYQYG